MDREAKETGNLECFFCGEMVVNADHHHLDGREGEALTDKTKIVRVHRRCHRQYHDVPVAKIPWFEGFLYRLMLHNIELYNKEILKLEK